jgi:hypothetical protein|tara:strand:- start:291 stop:761 length:471 start_codon:yes stop_codon:yes gene_type:complete
MSNQGVRGFYQITTTIKDNLLNDENVNTVTTGDITKIDLSKQTIYPLSHILVNNVSQEDQVLRFNISVFCMDIVDVSKDETTDTFVGNNNEHDVLNTQLAVINKLIETLRSGTLYQSKYQLDGVVSCEPFYDRFENEVAGWVGTMDILIDNDINIC